MTRALIRTRHRQKELLEKINEVGSFTDAGKSVLKMIKFNMKIENILLGGNGERN